MRRLPIIAFTLLCTAVAGTAPASAQETGEKVNQVIVYGNDPCPVSTGGEITVCARKEEAERYRIPEALRGAETPQNQAWTNRVIAYETVGASGTLSCSPVGPGGSTGCTQKLINAAYAEKRGGSDVRFSEMIAAEREKRLSTIDTEAAETQQRVEQLERQYEEKRRREEQGAAGQQPAGQ